MLINAYSDLSSICYFTVMSNARSITSDKNASILDFFLCYIFHEALSHLSHHQPQQAIVI